MDADSERAMAEHVERHTVAFRELCEAARGNDVTEVQRLVREFSRTYAPYVVEVDVVVTSRVMSDPRWALKQPLAALALSWRFRKVRPVDRTLWWLQRPRFTG